MDIDQFISTRLAQIESSESTFRVKVKETQFGQTLTSVCYVKSASSDKASLQAAIDNHPLNTGEPSHCKTRFDRR